MNKETARTWSESEIDALGIKVQTAVEGYPKRLACTVFLSLAIYYAREVRISEDELSRAIAAIFRKQNAMEEKPQ